MISGHKNEVITAAAKAASQLVRRQSSCNRIVRIEMFGLVRASQRVLGFAWMNVRLESIFPFHSTCVYSSSFIYCDYHAGCNSVMQTEIHSSHESCNPIYMCGPACRALQLFRFIILLKPRICNAMHEQWMMNECSLGITLYLQQRDVGS